jgi:hypothetical protein
MKKGYSLAVLAVSLIVGVRALGQDVLKPAGTALSGAPEGLLQTIDGRVLIQAHKLTLVSDTNHKVWSVQNPETLEDNEGEHVTVRAYLNVESSSIHVIGVEQLRGKW